MRSNPRIRNVPISVSTRRRLSVFAWVAVSLAVLAYATGCDLCANDDWKDYLSPDGRMKVVVFTRDCGATTDYSTQASVLPTAASRPRGVGNVFIADSAHGEAPGTKGPELAVRWLDSSTVELSHHAAARVFVAKTMVGEIRVVYKQWR
jgi:hypothetical protein